jgi:predicted CXXCH cytochrome family protein
LRITHAWVDARDAATDARQAGTIDATATDIERFRTYDVRFQIVNDSDEEASVQPRLTLAQADGDEVFVQVLPDSPTSGRAFYMTLDDGRVERATNEAIATKDLRLQGTGDGGDRAVPGIVVRRVSTEASLVLPAHTFTEIDFPVRATSSAGWAQGFTFRLEIGKVIARRDAAVLMAKKPAIDLTSGQRRGRVATDPIPLYPLQGPTLRTLAAFGAAAEPLLGATSPGSPHLDLSLTGDSCAACHSAHAAQGPLLQVAASPESNLCFRCHDGSTASDIKAVFEDPSLPSNDPATASVYAHPSTALSDHQSDREDEFGGRLDRHAACADCHQPHLADATAAEQTAEGWTASGAIKGASGVSVDNGVAGSSPTYTWNTTSALEYQLCFKCHSGFTQLPTNDPAHPSRWSIDKGVELNPANLSYHPVEAAGTNQTTAMAASLAGTSPYKLWTFQTDSTIRCVNCHGDPSVLDAATPPEPGSTLAPHASQERGLLTAAYRDRELKPNGEAYDAADFALCYLCHAESPMVDASGDPNVATNFTYHGSHLNLAAYEGVGGQDIDTDGAGQGNAVCAECHFRIHGTTNAVDGQPQTSRLVNFAPNVQPVNGVLRWSQTSTGGSCTLICHGFTHRGWSY